MSKLTGRDPYEMVNHASGKLANKLQELIEQHGDSPQVLPLAQDFIRWWYMPFDDPEKESVGREIWDRIDEVWATIQQSDDHDVSPDDSSSDQHDGYMTRLERAGNVVGHAVGRASGVTTNATIAGAAATGRWVKVSAAPTIKAGSRELWKGLVATVKATREAYRESRASTTADVPTNVSTDDDSPY